MVVIQYEKGWLCLNRRQLAQFFMSVRAAGGYDTTGDRCYYEEDYDGNDYTVGSFKISGSDEYLDVYFTDSEGCRTSIQKFMRQDIISLLQLESIIDSKIFSMTFIMKDVIGVIEDTAERCREDPTFIKKMAWEWSCNPIILEVAVNHFHFFCTYVSEYIEHNN